MVRFDPAKKGQESFGCGCYNGNRGNEDERSGIALPEPARAEQVYYSHYIPLVQLLDAATP